MFQRSSMTAGVGNCSNTRPLSLATTSNISLAPDVSVEKLAKSRSSWGVIFSSYSCDPVLKDFPTLQYISCGKPIPSLGNPYYLVASTSCISSSLICPESASYRNDLLVTLAQNPSELKGLRMFFYSSIAYAVVASFMFAAATAGTAMNFKVDSDGTSTISDKQGGGIGGSGGPGPSKQSEGEFIAFEDQPKQEARLSPLRKPYEVSIRAIKGFRLYMEDEYFVSDGGRFAAVFDGHGGNGVSRYLRENLYKHIRYYLYNESEEDYYKTWSSNTTNSSVQTKNPSINSRYSIPSIAHHISALRSAFRSVEREVISLESFQHVGSTAVAVMLHESENGSRTLISANIGDSRAVLSRRGKAINLTRDHKPNDEKEKSRIMALGEIVEWDPYSEVYRVCNLSLSRAIGDSYAKPYVSSEVEIKRLPLGNDGEDEFVVLASDGLWDVMDSEDVVDFVHQVLRAPVPLDENSVMTTRMRRRHMSRHLSNEAIRRGTGDNVCVVVVWLDKGVEGA